MLPKQPNQSIMDGIRCLQAVVSEERPVGVSEIARELDLEVTRVHRLLRTLAHTGLIDHTARRKYAPGPALPVLAAQTLHAIRFAGAPLRILDEFSKRLGRTVALGVRWQRSVSYLYHLVPGQAKREAVGAYGAWPAEKSGLGIALLSRLADEDIRGLYAGRTLDGYRSIESLLKTVHSARRTGYAYVRTGGRQRTLAMAFPSNNSMALGVAGEITRREVGALAAALRQTVGALDRAFSDAAERH